MHHDCYAAMYIVLYKETNYSWKVQVFDPYTKVQ